ncbi:MAG: feruloyl-CoA synthase, partial [Comamonadaceae bacterium]
MSTTASATGVRYRPLRFGVTRGVLRDGADGIRYLRAEQPLDSHASRMTDRFLHWVETTPDRTFMARREKLADGSTGEWKKLTYREAHEAARCIGQALLDRGLGPDRPVAILCENGLEHALLALGCLLVGVPSCPVSPPYATVSVDYDKLRHVLETITPGLVFVPDAARYG